MPEPAAAPGRTVQDGSGPAVGAAQLAALRALDTPTVCNALDLVDPAFGLHAVTSRPLRCVYPHLPPMVGFARTATIRAATPPRDRAATAELRVAYYEYVARGPGPTVVVMEDLDGELAGSGCMWGEVNTTIHQRLGSLGVVTNGSVRDVPDNAEGFQLLAGGVVPSRAHTHVVSFGEPVTVHGMAVRHGDLVHADQHGAVVVPASLVDEVVAAAGTVTRREQALLASVRKDGFTVSVLREAMRASSELH
ncbi:RraA family protein [Streptomyces sp. NBC_01476]|uniref:RraA family protein n=1 Tax=Streptomyces sp. NBC_01476 TaxID=2903881 RepID=UPI002E35EB2A|nr:RraA family protein [Streptomyces sp. NBC_01476]